MAADGSLAMVNEREIFWILARVAWDVCARLHFVGEVQWNKKQTIPHHPYGWEVRGSLKRSATIWASGRTRDPYFEILGATRGIMVTRSVGFDF